MTDSEIYYAHIAKQYRYSLAKTMEESKIDESITHLLNVAIGEVYSIIPHEGETCEQFKVRLVEHLRDDDSH